MTVKTLKVGYLQTNCYVIFAGAENAIVVDPGGSFVAIDTYLQKNGVKNLSVLLTHAHFDHILAVKELSDKYGAYVVIGKDDADSLNSDYNLAEAMGLEELPEIRVDKTVEDGEKFELYNIPISVIATPGHTKGSVCYIIDDIIFAGDTLFRESYGRTDFAGGSYAEMKKSLRKLFSLQGEYRVLTGHGEETSLEYERRYNPINYEI